ncbi:hypothetical protein DNTS_016517 [Danionella cerebrum]|uniref:Uncharacterized protein n=1 Tax=Danionella cerebrum TaxID=2873325 RepID=A0A553MR67_9TELE|nr:hypothetical protein DNTS_016517 [Danionella translucida]
MCELALFHTFSHIPVNKSSLGIHQIKLVIQTSPGFSDGCCVAQHAHSTLHLRQVSSRHHSRRLVVYAHLETSGTPVHKLNCALGFYCRDGGVDIFGNHISTVEKTAGHVLTMARVALHHLISWLKTSRSQGRRWPEGSGFEGRAPGWFETLSDLHSGLHQNAEML